MDNKPPEPDRESKESGFTVRKPYDSPHLLVYGEVRELTAGGTGNAVEPSSGQKVRA